MRAVTTVVVIAFRAHRHRAFALPHSTSFTSCARLASPPTRPVRLSSLTHSHAASYLGCSLHVAYRRCRRPRAVVPPRAHLRDWLGSQEDRVAEKEERGVCERTARHHRVLCLHSFASSAPLLLFLFVALPCLAVPLRVVASCMCARVSVTLHSCARGSASSFSGGAGRGGTGGEGRQSEGSGRVASFGVFLHRPVESLLYDHSSLAHSLAHARVLRQGSLSPASCRFSRRVRLGWRVG